MARVAALTGPSGSGKTTLIVSLIRRYTTEGLTVAAIKHTHHELNTEDRGDTARFLDAGADPVILAGEGSAVLRSNGARVSSPAPFVYGDPRELLILLATDIVLIEGFKRIDAWPRIEVAEAMTPDSVASVLDRIWRP
jgi:molybdopterin-guanine dinucleotide biosynthesis protein B